MSWIKDNKFAATLGGITLVGAAGLIVAGLQFSGKYAEAQASYEEQTSITNDAENLALYPTTANEQGKRKAVADYKAAAEALQTSFGKFRPEKLDNIPPQEFTNRLQAANAEVLAAFQASKTDVPGVFFLGFEGYTGSLAKGAATGILDFELGAMKELMLSLAKPGIAQLINVRREKLVEEDGGVFKEESGQVARPLSVEVTFKGSEAAARDFFSSIAGSDKHYYVVRSVRISNERKGPPLATDAKFDDPVPTTDAAPADGGFALPPDPAEAAPAADDAAPAPAAESAAPEAAAAAPAPVDTGRILQQVLGTEDIYVFVRIDIMQFLPAKKF
ncbi:MAG: Amuc_1100 family pilus-like protein [Akkermansiaceae bacterium]|nr:Amuc_1100 family pilus-like protein [Akkermansiaceae bacterium]